MLPILEEIVNRTRRDLQEQKTQQPQRELERQAEDLPPPRPFVEALAKGGFGLIAEIKDRSPSGGVMPPENVQAAPAAYAAAEIVRAFSILTNAPYFGTGLETLRRIRKTTDKPILRKDFFVDPYQILEARVAGADAILLMANVLHPAEMADLHAYAQSLGLAALCEVHTEEEIAALPPGANLVGINARKFKGDQSTELFARSQADTRTDFTLHFDAFALFPALPDRAVKVAESGLSAENLAQVLQTHPFHAGLVGTSLLKSADGPAAELARFAEAIQAWEASVGKSPEVP